MTNRKHIPKRFYAVMCNDDVDNSLFGGLPAPMLALTLTESRRNRKLLNERCCDGGHTILKLTTEVVK